MNLSDFLNARVVQTGVIEVASPDTEGTATIPTVDLAKAFIVPGGSSGADFANGSFHLDFADDETVRATRHGSASTGKVAYTVIELL
jgi:hypothetical protein